ncbi:MAG: helix-hairpin-helix domain-containing protein [Gammaproteobacteria bacterium]|nr:helix-hairpin-helix domain-containing protein [Gammaproteobacteria bacterium]
MKHFLFAILAISLTTPSAADVYKWVDSKGVTHYSDDAPSRATRPIDLPPPAVVDRSPRRPETAARSLPRQPEPTLNPASVVPAAPAPQNVNLNTADAETLINVLDGIGPGKAAAIIAYRKQHGPFKSIDELNQVRGIGPKTIAANRTRLSVK